MKKAKRKQGNPAEEGEEAEANAKDRNVNLSEEETALSDDEKNRGERPQGSKKRRVINQQGSKRTLRDRSSLKPPDRYISVADHLINHICIAEGDEPLTYTDAVQGPAAAMWKKAMEEEMETHRRNKTWSLTTRPFES